MRFSVVVVKIVWQGRRCARWHGWSGQRCFSGLKCGSCQVCHSGLNSLFHHRGHVGSGGYRSRRAGSENNGQQAETEKDAKMSKHGEHFTNNCVLVWPADNLLAKRIYLFVTITFDKGFCHFKTDIVLELLGWGLEEVR